MTTISEIAPDLFRISTFVPDFNLQFNQFLVRDDEPMLFHTGPRAMFAAVRDAVATLLDPAKVKWIGFSHLEADECGALQEWQQLAPESMAVCSLVGKLVSIDDCMAMRPALGMKDGDVLNTGKYRFQFLHTPHVPTRQENSIPMPSSSESSRMVCFGGLSPLLRSTRILADLLFFENVTSGPVAGAVGVAVVPGGAGAGLTVPKDSVFKRSGGTPISVRKALIDSIIEGGPHTWTLRAARSGTD